MNVSPRLLIAGGILAGTSLLYCGTAWWAGTKAEETLAAQHKMLAELPFFKVKQHSYQRGWFSSREETELVVDPALLNSYGPLLPDNLQPLLKSHIRFTHDIQHGPLPGLFSGNLHPARALVTTRFEMSDATRKTLSKFFGEQEPITLSNRLDFGGGGVARLNIPSFNYEETLAGVKMNWQGLDLSIDYNGDYTAYESELTAPGFDLEAGSKGKVAFKGLHYLAKLEQGSSGIHLGERNLALEHVGLQWADNIPYNLKLNELIYMISRVKVGSFINPSGALQLSNISLDKLSYRMETGETNSFIDTRGQASFAKLQMNQDSYGPFKLDVSANHLHGPTLARLDAALASLPPAGADQAAWRQHYIEVIRKHGVPLLANDPRIVLNDFQLKMPSGQASLQGEIGLKGFREPDLRNPLHFFQRFVVKAKFSLPERTLENLVLAQARNLFAVDASAAEQPNLTEVDDLARGLLQNQLAAWQAEDYIRRDNGQLSSSLQLLQGQLTVNRKKVPLPWEETDPNASDLVDTGL